LSSIEAQIKETYLAEFKRLDDEFLEKAIELGWNPEAAKTKLANVIIIASGANDGHTTMSWNEYGPEYVRIFNECMSYLGGPPKDEKGNTNPIPKVHQVHQPSLMTTNTPGRQSKIVQNFDKLMEHAIGRLIEQSIEMYYESLNNGTKERFPDNLNASDKELITRLDLLDLQIYSLKYMLFHHVKLK